MIKGNPVFDDTKEHGKIVHGDLEGHNPSEMPAFFQDGNYFRPDKSFHSTDGQPRKAAAPPKVPTAEVNTLPAVTEAETDNLLKDPRAAELLMLPRDQLMKLVTAANGPVISGERSTKMMVAWLVKNTAPSRNEL